MAMTEYESRRIRRKRRPPWQIIAVVAVVIIIVFAFIWEALLNSEPEIPDSFSPYPPNAQTEIQNRISGLSWISPEFLPINEFSRPGERLREVNAIVIHYIGNANTTAKQNRNYFAGLSKSGEDYLSSNFIVGLDGEILQCVPVDEIAYASNSRNDDTISIECCHPDETGEFTEETYDSVVKLTAWLCEAFELTQDDIIRHYDVTGKECPKFYVENEDAWEVFKADVADFMKNIEV